MSIDEEDSIYEKNAKNGEMELLPKLTDDFLDSLVLAVRTCGWSVDHVESAEFVKWCFHLADKEAPDLEPFDYSGQKNKSA